ncbi:MAG: hypothetical protein ACLFVO_08465 [Chloroflexaceae bacterium]
MEVPRRVESLDELMPLIERYHHTVRAGQYDEARTLFWDRIWTTIYYQFGAYQLQIELLQALFPGGEPFTPAGQAILPRLADEGDQAWTLNELANSFSRSGQPRHAIPLFERSNAIAEQRGNKRNLAIGLGNLANRHRELGALRAAEANLHRRIALGREIGDAFREAIGHQALGRLLAYRGAWAAAAAELTTALEMVEQQNNVQSQGIIWAYCALFALLQAREAALPAALTDHADHAATALTAARRALELADEDARISYPVERDYVRAHWLLGAAHRVNGVPASAREQQFAAAEQHLTEALTRCRSINLVDHEADILLELARLRAATGNRMEALRLAQEALTITERCGYVLPGADGHLLLAGIYAGLDHEMGALDHEGRESERERREQREQALGHARAARRLATCDGPPDYTYRVAYDEAGHLLTCLGEPPAEG